MDSIINSVLGPFLPAPVLNFVRSRLTTADSTLSNYAPKFLVDQLPLLASLVALYFGFLSVMRAARVAWRSFLFFAKYGGLALFGTILYSLYQGDTTALRSSLSTATNVASNVGSFAPGLASLGSLATWWLGAQNTDTLKNVGSYAAKYFSPQDETATAGSRKTKKSAGASLWDSVVGGGAGSPAANTRSSKRKNSGEVDPKGLFEEVFGETPKRAGGGGGADSGDIVSGFLEKVVGAAGGDTALKLKKMAEMGWEAMNGEGDGQGKTKGR